MPKTVAFTGHRPQKLGGFDERNPQTTWVKLQIRKGLQLLKPKRVIAGGALGVDTWAAEEALEQGIPLTLAIPFEGFEERWPAAAQQRFDFIWHRCDECHVVCPEFSIAAYQRRNEWMVDHSNMLIAFWDGSAGGTANCFRYAQQVGRQIRRINPANWA